MLIQSGGIRFNQLEGPVGDYSDGCSGEDLIIITSQGPDSSGHRPDAGPESGPAIYGFRR
jgi:hypothetical protein